MTSFDVLAAIDAIVTDLQTQASGLGLGAFDVQRYVQPLWESAEMPRPLLAVYVKEVDPLVESTSGEYDFRNRVTVGWFEPVPNSLTDLIVDNTQARGIITRAQAIYKNIATRYFAGIPGYGPEAEVTVHKVRFGKVQGGVMGAEIDLVIADWA